MSIYYTPELTEFKEKFEYEAFILEKKIWSKEIFYLNDSHIELIKKTNIRVKYLDSDDIKSFGFEYDEKNQVYKSIKTYLGISTGDDKKLIISYIEEDNDMVIFYKSKRGEEYIIFEGIIKNKSELAMILKMTQTGL